MEYQNYNEMKVGDMSETTIKLIREGTQDEFRGMKYWEASELSKSEIQEAKKQKAIEIICANDAKMVIALPDGLNLHPKTSLARYKATYGHYPQEGDKVKTMMDKNGFNRIVLQD